MPPRDDTDRVSTPTYEAEARARWGHTQAFRESQRRAARYGPADWTRIQAEARDIEERLAAELAAGSGAGSAAVLDLAEEHRGHLSRWFYECPPALHCALADLYVTDERFTAHYDEIAPGLAAFLAAAIRANADRSEDDGV
jgi:hypothetical protein